MKQTAGKKDLRVLKGGAGSSNYEGEGRCRWVVENGRGKFGQAGLF